MADVINNYKGGARTGEDSGGAGLIIGVIIALLLIVLFFVYGLPAIRNSGADQGRDVNVDVQLPDTNTGSTVTPSTDGNPTPTTPTTDTTTQTTP